MKRQKLHFLDNAISNTKQHTTRRWGTQNHFYTQCVSGFVRDTRSHHEVNVNIQVRFGPSKVFIVYMKIRSYRTFKNIKNKW